MTTYKAIKEILNKFLDSKITLSDMEFKIDGKSMSLLPTPEARVYGSTIEQMMVMLAVLKRLMPIRFDVLSSGDRDTPVIIHSSYIIETVSKDLRGDYSTQDVFRSVAYISDEDGFMNLSVEEYDEIYELLKKVRDTGMMGVDNIIFCIENKRLNDDEIDEGIRHIYEILAPNDNILANFSCAGHIEGHMKNGKLEYVLDPPSIMIDYSPVIDMKAILVKAIESVNSTMFTGTYRPYSFIIDSVNFETRFSRSICDKTWDNRVMLTYSGKKDSVFNMKNDAIGGYMYHGVLIEYLTNICKEIAKEAK